MAGAAAAEAAAGRVVVAFDIETLGLSPGDLRAEGVPLTAGVTVAATWSSDGGGRSVCLCPSVYLYAVYPTSPARVAVQ